MFTGIQIQLPHADKIESTGWKAPSITQYDVQNFRTCQHIKLRCSLLCLENLNPRQCMVPFAAS